MKAVLYIYLFISLVTLLVIVSSNISHIIRYKRKFKDIEIIKSSDSGSKIIMFNVWLKVVIICFIPLVNLIYLFLFIFFEDEITKRVDKKFKHTISKDL